VARRQPSIGRQPPCRSKASPFAASSRIPQSLRLLDRLTEIRVSDGGGDYQVNWPSEELLQGFVRPK
jgi:hypothetical protein